MSPPRWLRWLAGAPFDRPRAVLGGCALLVALAAWAGAGVEFRSSRAELAPPDDPDQARWTRFLEEYRGSEALIAVVEPVQGAPADPDGLRRTADALARRLGSDPRVEQVFHRVDHAWLLARAPWFVPPATLTRLRETLVEHAPALAGLDGPAALNEALAGRIEAGLSGLAAGGPAPDPAGIELMVRLLEGQRRLLERPGATADRWTRGAPLEPLAASLAPGAAAGGYLATRDGRSLFLFVTPRSAADDLEARRALLARMRAHAAAVVEEHAPATHRVGWTGTAAMAVEEMDAVRADSIRGGLFAIAGVGLLTALVFRWRSHALLVLVALACGVVWAFGAVRIELGYLNLITSSFVSTLVGVGVGYGIHPVSEYELEGAHLGEPAAVARESFRRTAPAVAAAALTTAAAFFSILLMPFRGFAELGLVAGVGVLLCLVAALVSLPALLVVHGRWRRRFGAARPRSRPLLDRLGADRLAGRLCRRPLPVVALALAITLAAALAAPGLRLDTNLLELLPRDAESLRYQRRMIEDSDLAPVFNVVTASGPEQLRRLSRRAAAEPAVARFESALRLLPAEDVAGEVAALQRALAAVELPSRAASVDHARLETSLSRLERALAEAAGAAFTGGAAELAGPLERARAVAEASRETVRAAPAGAEARWSRASSRLLERSRAMLDALRAASAMPRPGPGDLPADVRDRFVTRSGEWIGFLYPAGSVFEPDSLAGYVAASRRVSPQAIGFPLLLHEMSGRISRGFVLAVVAGALAVVVVLLADLRSFRDAVLAATPLALGLVWTLGAMRLAGLSFNFANLVAVPLIIGVGIDNGVHVVHRMRLERGEGMDTVLRHTGRAILIASLTTMTGFGSLALASHRGLASLGLVLLIGVGSCLIASTVVLPALVVLSGVRAAGPRTDAAGGVG